MSEMNTPTQALPDSFAVIDVGSNTVRAFCGRHMGGEIAEIEVDRTIQPRLGARIDKTGRLDLQAVERVAEFVDGFVADHGPFERVYCVGTAATREADNTEILRRKLATAEVQLEVLSARREAELTHQGALAASEIEAEGNRTSVIDVGGNSTEISTGADGEIWVASVSIGAVRLTERCLQSDPINPEDLAEAQELAAGSLEPHESLLEGADAVVGAGGTAVSAGLLCDRWRVSAEALRQLTEGLAAIPLQQRRDLLSFDPDRAEIIVGGLAILQLAVNISPLKHVHISTGGLREGVLVEAGASEIRRECGPIGAE